MFLFVTSKLPLKIKIRKKSSQTKLFFTQNVIFTWKSVVIIKKMFKFALEFK
jgi:hypothetical protein